MDITVMTAATDIFGKEKEHIDPLTPEFIEKLEDLCDITPFPIPILQQFQKGGINKPHKLVNTFGGSISASTTTVFYEPFNIPYRSSNCNQKTFQVCPADTSSTIQSKIYHANKMEKDQTGNYL